MKKKILISLFAFFSFDSSFGEYRVYQYYVRPKIQNITIVDAEFVTSTLDPVAYVAYHGGSEAVEVNLLRSWQCMGYTSKQEVCTISEGRELKSAATSLAGEKP